MDLQPFDYSLEQFDINQCITQQCPDSSNCLIAWSDPGKSAELHLACEGGVRCLSGVSHDEDSPAGALPVSSVAAQSLSLSKLLLALPSA